MTLWTDIKDSLHDAAQIYIPQKTVKKRESCPWISARTRRTMKRNGIFRKAKLYGHSDARYELLKMNQKMRRADHPQFINTLVSDEGDGTHEKLRSKNNKDKNRHAQKRKEVCHHS